MVDHASEPIRGTLGDLRPLSVKLVAARSENLRLFNSLLAQHHYLGHRNTVGENLRYMLCDRHHSIQATIKDVYLYPLTPHFRQELCA